MKRTFVTLIACVLLLATPTSVLATSWSASTHLRLTADSSRTYAGGLVTFTIRLRSARNRCVASQPVKWFRNGAYRRTYTTNDRGRVRVRLRMHTSAAFRAKYLGRRWGSYPNRYTCYSSASRRVYVQVGPLGHSHRLAYLENGR